MMSNHTRKKGPKSKKHSFMLLVIILVVILIITLIINIILYIGKPVATKEVPVHFTVDDFLGVDLVGGDELEFGVVMPGFAADKKIILENQYEFPVRIEILMSYDLEGYIFGQREILLNPGDEVYYHVSLKVPQDAAIGNYTGTLLFETYKDE